MLQGSQVLHVTIIIGWAQPTTCALDQQPTHMELPPRHIDEQLLVGAMPG